MSDPYIVERHDLGREAWAVFTGCEGEDPHLVALVFDKELAEKMCRAIDPDPAEDGRHLCFDADVVVAIASVDITVSVLNDYRYTDISHEDFARILREGNIVTPGAVAP